MCKRKKKFTIAAQWDKSEVSRDENEVVNEIISLPCFFGYLHHCATVPSYVLDFLSVLILCHVLWVDKGRAESRRKGQKG